MSRPFTSFELRPELLKGKNYGTVSSRFNPYYSLFMSINKPILLKPVDASQFGPFQFQVINQYSEEASACPDYLFEVPGPLQSGFERIYLSEQQKFFDRMLDDYAITTTSFHDMYHIPQELRPTSWIQHQTSHQYLSHLFPRLFLLCHYFYLKDTILYKIPFCLVRIEGRMYFRLLAHTCDNFAIMYSKDSLLTITSPTLFL